MPVGSFASRRFIDESKKTQQSMCSPTHTEAPGQFVPVLFSYRLRKAEGTELYVHGNVSHGRSPEGVQQLRGQPVAGSDGGPKVRVRTSSKARCGHHERAFVRAIRSAYTYAHVMAGEWTEKTIAEEVGEFGCVRPPWVRHPEIEAGSIGWRMGYGEGWRDVWHTWLGRQGWGPTERLAYLAQHPAPHTWVRTVLAVLEPSAPGAWDEPQVARTSELSAAGLLGVDVSYPAWKAVRPAGSSARSVTRDCLRDAQRHRSRELGFLGRWAQESRGTPMLDEWLRGAEQADASWRPFLSALARGRMPSTLPPCSRERVAVRLAAVGRAAAPWALGAAASTLTESFDDEVGDADAWHGWAWVSFEDRPSFATYLESQPPFSEAWDAMLRRCLPWLYPPLETTA